MSKKEQTELVEATSIEDAIAYLCRSDKASFYAYVFNALERVYAVGTGTFYVTPRGSRYVLVIDPRALERYNFEDLVAIMEHEVLHIILNHVPRGLRLYGLCATAEDKYIYHIASNLAADCAVNEIVRRNHASVVSTMNEAGWVTAEREELPPDASFEEYLMRMTARIKDEVEDPEALFTLALQLLHGEACAAAEVLGIPRNGVLPLPSVVPTPDDTALEALN